jgi:NSS family neurotransmitter:Na+ symporter
MSIDDIRESWATRVGFILAAVGSAVGLGNVWRFPFQVGQEGGAAFLVVYLFFILLVGLPAILVEFTIGRREQLNPVGSLREYGGQRWQYVGGLFMFIAFLIMSYYSVVAGWVLRYFLGSFTGAYLDQPEGYFTDIAVGLDALAFHALFLLLVVVIVALGVQRGIELAAKLMVPSLIVLLAGLAIYAATLSGAGDAYSYYLSPEFDLLSEEWRSIVPAAAGQAFFTLSLGMGIMITYASYLSEDENLAADGGIIIGFDTAVAFIAGLVAFPILFTAGVEPADPGAGAIFVALAGGFGEIAYGQLLGIVFFFAFALGALTSAISLTEVVVSYAIDEHGAERMRATLAIGGGMFLLGAPVTIDLVMVDLYDILAAQILLVAGSVLLMILVGWQYPEKAIDELGRGIGDLGALGRGWIWLVRIPVLVVLLVTLALAIDGYVDFLTGDFAEFLNNL